MKIFSKKDDTLDLINYDGVCRIAPATPGWLKILSCIRNTNQLNVASRPGKIPSSVFSHLYYNMVGTATPSVDLKSGLLNSRACVLSHCLIISVSPNLQLNSGS